MKSHHGLMLSLLALGFATKAHATYVDCGALSGARLNGPATIQVLGSCTIAEKITVESGTVVVQRSSAGQRITGSTGKDIFVVMDGAALDVSGLTLSRGRTGVVLEGSASLRASNMTLTGQSKYGIFAAGKNRESPPSVDMTNSTVQYAGYSCLASATNALVSLNTTTIQHCNNAAAAYPAAVALWDGSNVTIAKTTVQDNGQIGVYLGPGSTASFSDTTISNNSVAAVMSMKDSIVLIGNSALSGTRFGDVSIWDPTLAMNPVLYSGIADGLLCLGCSALLLEDAFYENARAGMLVSDWTGQQGHVSFLAGDTSGSFGNDYGLVLQGTYQPGHTVCESSTLTCILNHKQNFVGTGDLTVPTEALPIPQSP